MSSFVAGLTAAQLGTIEHQLSGYMVDLTLPKFSADSRFDLADVLTAMGMPTAFEVPTPSGGADLSGITLDESLYIQHVIHEANIDVDENGVVASAVTVVIGGPGLGAGTAAHGHFPHRQAVPLLHPGTLDGRHPLHGSHRRSVRHQLSRVGTNRPGPGATPRPGLRFSGRLGVVRAG